MYTINPITGRRILVGGATHKRLQNGGGWKTRAPSRGEERKIQYEKCGDKCFLLPEKYGFPICAKGTCDPDCDGIVTAYRRARQYHHEDVAQRAIKKGIETNCGWAMKYKQ